MYELYVEDRVAGKGDRVRGTDWNRCRRLKAQGDVGFGLVTGQVLPGAFLCGLTRQAARATESQASQAWPGPCWPCKSSLASGLRLYAVLALRLLLPLSPGPALLSVRAKASRGGQVSWCSNSLALEESSPGSPKCTSAPASASGLPPAGRRAAGESVLSLALHCWEPCD